MEKEYKANGLVYGKYWGGGRDLIKQSLINLKQKKDLINL